MKEEKMPTTVAAKLALSHRELLACHCRVWRAKREWESIMDCLDYMVLLADENGRVIRCNQALACFLGKPFEEINGLPWEALLTEQGLVKEVGVDGVAEYSQATTDRVFCGRFFPFAAEYTDTRGTVVILQDVTEQQRIARELQHKNYELAGAYEELKGSQVKMLQQEKLASIGQLAAGVAHEINNPVGFVTSNLGSMVKYLERLREFVQGQQRLLLAEGDPAERRRQVEELHRRLKIDFVLEDAADLLRESLEGVERVKVIVQNLKKFSRGDQARSGKFDLNQCLEETLNIIWNELKYKAKINKDYGDLPLTWGYPQQLNQVFMNLLLNAVQALDGPGEITLRTRAEGDEVHIIISDTGCGVPPENLDRLFEPFFTTKEVGKGTGLGLSIVYDIVVKQHGGDITVDSAPGQGTTFLIRLPVRQQQVEAKTTS
ncbi:ATP-binding protein [Desulfurivibrio dismutans]|uniref:ATP-binding protein n=1 Tax=Desulfurivibrio dismutans TaxID=1398908 RepID=UPI0023DC97ED|nr:ATP-binding protein [Desulfurivibrio alkaliphilus]MDF1614524.1 ATP-binding protein [Desulfurivibrio alkaliphilus]